VRESAGRNQMSSPVVYLDFGVFLERSRTVLVELHLCAVSPTLEQASALRFSLSRVGHRVAGNSDGRTPVSLGATSENHSSQLVIGVGMGLFLKEEQATYTPDDLSHGVRFLSAKAAQVIALCWFASPTRSTLRVSHSLGGFPPPEPGGFISCHIRP
jgi:hypothetical protein